MNARVLVREKLQTIRECEHRTAKIILAVLAALFSGAMIRTTCWALVTFGPDDTWAVEQAERLIAMTGLDFWMAIAIASWGGAASLFHELRTDIQKFSVLNATGHMVIAQFAGVSGFMLAVHLQMPWALGMLVCGSFGWGGNRALLKLNNALMGRVLGANKDGP